MGYATRFSSNLVSPTICFRLLFLFVTITSGTAICRAENKSDWVEVRSPNFVVVTDGGERQGRILAYQFEMIRAVFQYDFKQKDGSGEPPLTILAAKDEATMRALLPEFWAKRGSSHPSGLFLNALDTNYIAVQLDAGSSVDAVEPYEPVYHEYVHYLTRRLIARLPLWMAEGLAEFYGNTQVHGKTVMVGRYSPINLSVLQRTPLLPVETLFTIDASSPYYHEQDKTSIFYAESWALTHYLFIRDYEDHTKRLPTFLAALQIGEDPDVAAAKTIGSAASLNEPLRKYMRNTTFRAAPAAVPDVDQTKFGVRPMSEAKALAVRADFMGHDGHDAEAEQMLQRAVKEDPRLAVAYEALAFLALRHGKTAEAEKWSEQAVALSPESYRANYYYGWSLLGEGALEDEETTAKAEVCMRTVIKNNPAFASAYDAMAYILEMEGGKERLDEAHRMALQAVDREPGNVEFRVRVAEILERQGRPADAVRVATIAASVARTPEERQKAAVALENAERFRDSWEKTQTIGEGTNAEGRPALVLKVRSGETPGNIPAAQQVRASARIMIVTDTEGVDFNSYLTQQVDPKIQGNWMSRAMSLSEKAATKKGAVIFEFSIGLDGSVAGIKRIGSAQPTLDDAVRSAIEDSSPFPSLPTTFHGKEIGLRFEAYYNPMAAANASSGSQAGHVENGDDKSEQP